MTASYGIWGAWDRVAGKHSRVLLSKLVCVKILLIGGASIFMIIAIVLV